MITSQGANSCGWTVSGISSALNELLGENGYPTGQNLSCPVWNGNKIRYLNLIPDFAIPSMELNLDNFNLSDITSEIIM
jgi:hypothetical protein